MGGTILTLSQIQITEPMKTKPQAPEVFRIPCEAFDASALIDLETRVVQFFALSSAVKGSGRSMVAAVVAATPPDWSLVVPLDWSGGFWQRMAQDYPRLRVW
jgi:hypothetical protein